MIRKHLVFFLLLLSFPILSAAQNWSGILDPSRAINWASAAAGAIPPRTFICATPSLAAGTGAASANATAINSAIAHCKSGQVMSLPAGTWYIGSRILFDNKSNVTLRGAGADQTFLIFTNKASGSWAGDVVFQNSDTNYTADPHNTANWTAGYTKGANQITISPTLGSIRNLHRGSLIILDQCDDGLSGTDCSAGSVAGSDTGNIWVCGSDGAANVCCTGCHTGAGRFNRRHQQQIVEVAAIKGNTITLEDSLYMPNWRSAQTPGAWWSNGPAITGSGVENLSMDHASSTATVGTVFYNAYRCWMRGVRDLNSDRDHVVFYQSAHVTVRDSYFYGTKNARSESFGVEQFEGSSNLVENNVFQHIVSPLLSDDGQGAVFGYNYSADDHYTAQAAWMMAQGWHHGPGNSYFLWEGNQGEGIIADSIHGTADMITAFRNRYRGTDTNQSAQTIPVNVYAFSRYFNLVGNVLGTVGYHRNYETNITNFNQHACEISIYALGLGGSCRNKSTVPNDALAISTLMRWGNWDTVTQTARFLGTEVPSGISAYPNPVPSSQTLPASFYISTKPTWWGSMPWPATGPDISGGDVAGVSGHSYNIPAAKCYLNVMGGKEDGTSGILTFNADRCYNSGPGGAPAAAK